MFLRIQTIVIALTCILNYVHPFQFKLPKMNTLVHTPGYMDLAK